MQYELDKLRNSLLWIVVALLHERSKESWIEGRRSINALLTAILKVFFQYHSNMQLCRERGQVCRTPSELYQSPPYFREHKES